ncbi:hypothetical protein GYMLUDRAFT_875036 [Collybiopsis luxurians FD-317 M1]|nr:hypothetical protein GYMLUDRAFT_875036 [Collybiopsis luxurians FD-317 M1]
MTNEDADFLQEEALNQLSRQELQNLGKAHNVKANLKSSTIIARLLEKFPDGVPSSKNDAQPKPSQKTAGAKNKKTLKKEENVFHALERDKFASPSRTSKVRTPKVQTRKGQASLRNYSPGSRIIVHFSLSNSLFF